MDTVIQYVEAVLDGTQEPDNSIGRALNSLILSLPKMDSDQFEEMLNSNLKDLLMVVYLSQMTKAQLQLNEKLSMVSVNNIREVAKLLPVEWFLVNASVFKTLE